MNIRMMIATVLATGFALAPVNSRSQEPASDVATATEQAVENTAAELIPDALTPPATAELQPPDVDDTPPPGASEEVAAGDDAAEPEPAATGTAKIACEEPVYDFGKVDSSTAVKHTFVIRNDGDGLLKIGKVKPACGCTVANITSKELQPGQTAEISTTLSLKNKIGKQRKTIAIQSNDPNQPKFTLALTGLSVTEVDVKPRRIFVSSAVQGEPNEQKITVTSNSQEPMTITEVATGNDLISAEVKTVTEGKAYEILVRTSGDLPKGQTHGRVRIDTSSQKVPMLNVPFQYNVIGELAVAPTEIAMVEQPDAQLTRNVVVRPGTVKEFSIVEVVSPQDAIEVTTRNMAGNGFMIQMKNITPSLELNGQALVIRTDAKGMEEISVPFRVVKRPNPS